MKKEPLLSLDLYYKIIRVFEQNGWEIPRNDAGNESAFNRFCDRLSMLEKEEQELVVDLAMRFTKINGNDYLMLIKQLLNILQEKHSEVFVNTKYYILPLIAQKDIMKTKSSKFVWYYFRDDSVKFCPLFYKKQLVYFDTPNASQLNSVKQDEKIILVDDYIGSGETAVEALQWLTKANSIDSQQIIVLSIAAQQLGIKYIMDTTGALVYSLYLFQRGISDYYGEYNKTQSISIMQQIEAKMRVEEKFKFGYNRSEALISLIRTPNNTFPVFWLKRPKYGDAPFPRD